MARPVLIALVALLLGCGDPAEAPKPSNDGKAVVGEQAPGKGTHKEEPPRRSGEPTVAIVGDSISHGGNTLHRLGKKLEELLRGPFPGATVETFAVPGHTCAQLVERFRGQVVVSGEFNTVVIQCGTNDLYNDRELKDTLADIRTMVTFANEAGLRAIVLDVGPANGYPGWDEEKEAKRVALNSLLETVNTAVSVDISSVLSEGSEPRLKGEYLITDSIHPNDEGLDAMAKRIFSIAFAGGGR